MTANDQPHPTPAPTGSSSASTAALAKPASPRPRPRPETIVGAAKIDDESFDALLSVMRTPLDKRPAGPHIPAVGPRHTAALGLLSRAHGQWATLPTDGADIMARQPGYIPVGVELTKDVSETGREVPPLLLLIPYDHEQNTRDDEHTDFETLRAQGLIRDRDGEVIEIRSIWHAWGAYRIDRFFQAYCRTAKTAHARGEALPADSVRDWVQNEAARIGMPLEMAHRIIRDGCGGVKNHNAGWWRGASLKPAGAPSENSQPTR